MRTDAAAKARGEPPPAWRQAACGCGGGCEACSGTGIVTHEAFPPGLLHEVGEVLEAWGFIGRFGLEAWMRLHGEPDPTLIDAVLLIDQELAVLEAKDEMRKEEQRRLRR